MQDNALSNDLSSVLLDYCLKYEPKDIGGYTIHPEGYITNNKTGRRLKVSSGLVTMCSNGVKINFRMGSLMMKHFPELIRDITDNANTDKPKPKYLYHADNDLNNYHVDNLYITNRKTDNKYVLFTPEDDRPSHRVHFFQNLDEIMLKFKICRLNAVKLVSEEPFHHDGIYNYNAMKPFLTGDTYENNNEN